MLQAVSFCSFAVAVGRLVNAVAGSILTCRRGEILVCLYGDDVMNDGLVTIFLLVVCPMLLCDAAR